MSEVVDKKRDKQTKAQLDKQKTFIDNKTNNYTCIETYTSLI